MKIKKYTKKIVHHILEDTKDFKITCKIKKAPFFVKGKRKFQNTIGEVYKLLG